MSRSRVIDLDMPRLPQARPAMKLALAAALAVLSGCAAAPGTPAGPAATADGSFTITRQGDTFYAQPSELTAMAMRDAETHCLNMGKKFKEIRSRETPTTPGRSPWSEVLYRCD